MSSSEKYKILRKGRKITDNDTQTEKEYQYELITLGVSILIGFCYSLVTLQFQGRNLIDFTAFAAVTYGVFISAIVSLISLTLKQVRALPKIQELIDRVRVQQSEQRNLLELLSQDEHKLRGFRTHLSSLDRGLEDLGTQTLNNYLQSITTVENGFSVKGSYWALQAYEKFWKLLVAEQKRISESNEHNSLIARITHTNDIRLLNPKESPQSRLILLHEQEFIEAGGVIVRILIGHAKDINAPSAEGYRIVKDYLEEIGVEVKYISKDGEDYAYAYAYDFAWVDHIDYVVKWYSDVGGRTLDKCEILDKTDEDIKTIWRVLADRAQKEDSLIEKIPNSRTMDKYDAL